MKHDNETKQSREKQSDHITVEGSKTGEDRRGKETKWVFLLSNLGYGPDFGQDAVHGQPGSCQNCVVLHSSVSSSDISEGAVRWFIF